MAVDKLFRGVPRQPSRLPGRLAREKRRRTRACTEARCHVGDGCSAVEELGGLEVEEVGLRGKVLAPLAADLHGGKLVGLETGRID